MVKPKFAFVLLLSFLSVATLAFSIHQPSILGLNLVNFCPNPVYRSDEWMKTFIDGLKEQKFDSDTMKYLRDNISTDSHVFSTAQFSEVLQSIQFDSSKQLALELLNQYIVGLSAEFIVSILNSFSFSSSKVDALERIATTLNQANQDSKQTIINAFTFGSDKAKASQILANIGSRNCIYGTASERTVAYIIDTSDSMSQSFQVQGKVISRLAYIKGELTKTIAGQLRPSQKFNIIVLSTSVIQWQSDYVDATIDNIKDAISFINSLTANGVTNISGGFDAAFNTKVDLREIILLSDGVPTTGISTSEGFQKYLEDKNAGKEEKVVVNTVLFMLGGTESALERDESFKIMNAIAGSTNGSFKGYTN